MTWIQRMEAAMKAEECDLRAAACAASAASAPAESIALEFLKLAAQWRAMAVRDNFLGQLGDSGIPPPIVPGSTGRAKN